MAFISHDYEWKKFDPHLIIKLFLEHLLLNLCSLNAILKRNNMGEIKVVE